MTARALMYVDKQTFWRFVNEARDGARYEYVRGWIMQQQACGTLKHARLGVRFASYLDTALDASRWTTTGSDRAIETGDAIRYADVVVEPAGAPGSSLATTSPILVVEVLSPSSEERDLSTKPSEYLSLPSLEAYIVASQDEPLCYVWQRRADGMFDAAPQVVKGRDQSNQIAALSVALPLARVYAGIGE